MAAASPSGSSAELPITTEGAPSSQVPCPANDTPLHLRAEENGVLARTVHPGGAWYRAASARIVPFGASSAPATAPRTSAISAGDWRPSTVVSDTRMPGLVSVPVLSI